MKIEIVTEFNEFVKLRQTWNATLDKSGNDKVYLTHEWFTSWWPAFGKDKELFVLLVKQNDEVVGIAPLMISKSTFRGFPIKRIEFIENDDSPRSGFIFKDSPKEIIECIKAFLIKNVKRWDMFFLKNVLCDGIGDEIINVIKNSGAKYLVNQGLTSPYLLIDSEWEEYKGSLSVKSRKTIRNICNRIKRLENIRVERIKNKEGINDIRLVSEKGWKFKEGKAFINREDRSLFFELLSKEAQDRNWLSIWCMYKDNVAIAYEYHLTYKNEDVALLAEFDGEYKKYSPGAFLDYEIMKSVFNDGIHEYDMCGSRDEYKKKWTDNNREHMNITVFNDSLYSGFLYFVEKKVVGLLKKTRDKITR